MVCSGDTATLTCNITGATSLQWFMLSSEIVTLDSTQSQFSLGESTPRVVRNTEFSYSLLATSPQFVSELRFVPGDDRIPEGVSVSCRERLDSGNFRQDKDITVARNSELYASIMQDTLYTYLISKSSYVTPSNLVMKYLKCGVVCMKQF